MKMYLYEGLNKQDCATMMLWESAGRAIYEANLTPQQITQLFQQIEQGATAIGGNRTALGLTKDAGSAVMKAYNDLKTKVANSGPIKNMDAMYDQAAAKLKQATGGDQGVMQYVQKYRDFAKKHPVAQSIIYGALIGAAGISGAGAGGAAALGLFKMVDKLLQGEKFSSAAYSGAKTGAMAYAAGQIGKALKGDQQVPPGADKLTGLPANADWMDYEQALEKVNPTMLERLGNTLDDPSVSDEYKTELLKLLYPFRNSIKNPAAIDRLVSSVSQMASHSIENATQQAVAAAGSSNFESRQLSNKKILALFERVARLNSRMLAEGRLEEGLFDKFKSKPPVSIAGQNIDPKEHPDVYNKAIAAGKKPGLLSRAGSAIKQGINSLAQKAGTAGHNLTTKVTADKLQSAWKKAGSPTDSAEIENILYYAGVSPDVINTVFKSNNIPMTRAQPDQETPTDDQGTTDGSVEQPQDGQPTPTSGDAPEVQPTPQPTPQGGKPLPDISKYTPEQKQQLIQLIDTAIAKLSPGQSQSTKTTKPKVNYQDYSKNLNTPQKPLKVSPSRNPGAPTPDEQANLQAKLQAALKAQDKQ